MKKLKFKTFNQTFGKDLKKKSFKKKYDKELKKLLKEVKSKKTKILTSLNPLNSPTKDEDVIDIFTSGMGAYCGSFCVPKKHSKRYMVAINIAEHLMIDGIQTNYSPIYATIRKHA